MKGYPAQTATATTAVSARGAFDAISPSTSRVVALINDRPFTVSRLLRTIQEALETLPPADPLSACSAAEMPAAVDG